MAVNFSAIQAVAILTNAAVVYEPSVFNGTGLEIRRNLVLKVDTQVREQLLALEQEQGVSGSVVKPDTICVKIDMNAVKIFGADHKPMEAPGRWTHPNVEVRLEVRGTWKAASGNGLSICCTDIRFCTDELISPFFTKA